MAESYSHPSIGKPEPKRKAMPKVMQHMKIEHAENGGHIVTHEFKHYDHPSEAHVFAAGEGKKMLAHIGKHMGVAESAEENEDGTE